MNNSDGAELKTNIYAEMNRTANKYRVPGFRLMPELVPERSQIEIGRRGACGDQIEIGRRGDRIENRGDARKRDGRRIHARPARGKSEFSYFSAPYELKTNVGPL